MSASARKRKLIFKRYSIGRGPYWRFRRAMFSDMESSMLFGIDFETLKSVPRSITFQGLTTFEHRPEHD